ncbi:YfiR family protein [uncultured Nitrosomonas sp.]|uniref:YfiR family protein n=1 Tax=uncultured Nitrosomonas sp. TaxID=156424 RepID=UPI0025DFBD36|nr:YfiR family protein [uncultured Nitrosomonas sp.]
MALLAQNVDMQFYNQLIKLLGTSISRCVCYTILALWLGYGPPISHSLARADSILEYQVKAAFIYNFIAFTHWPSSTKNIIHLCIYGEDYFGDEIDKLQNRPADKRRINVARINDPDQFKQCQVIFFSKSVGHNLASILDSLPNKPILTLADTPNATSKGVAINMNLMSEKIVFEINLAIARKSGLDFSSKLLQLAAKVY